MSIYENKFQGEELPRIPFENAMMEPALLQILRIFNIHAEDVNFDFCDLNYGILYAKMKRKYEDNDHNWIILNQTLFNQFHAIFGICFCHFPDENGMSVVKVTYAPNETVLCRN